MWDISIGTITTINTYLYQLAMSVCKFIIEWIRKTIKHSNNSLTHRLYTLSSCLSLPNDSRIKMMIIIFICLYKILYPVLFDIGSNNNTKKKSVSNRKLKPNSHSHTFTSHTQTKILQYETFLFIFQVD